MGVNEAPKIHFPYLASTVHLGGPDAQTALIQCSQDGSAATTPFALGLVT